MFHLNHCFIISQLHVKNLVLHYFSNLRYFGRREDIFCPFLGILVGYHDNVVPFWISFDIFKIINMYTPYLDTSHWLESPFKIMGIKLLKAKLSQTKSFLKLLVSQKLLVKFVSSKTTRILIVPNNLQSVIKILKQPYKSSLLY